METHLNGIRVQFADVGSGPAVLLLHAFPLSGTMWRHLTTRLSGRYRLVVPDLRGFGATDAPPGSYSMDQHADDAAALLDHLGVQRVAVVGLSMGGYIAFAFWRRYAQRVTALVLADTKAGADSDEARAGRETNARLVEEQGPGVLADKLVPGLVAPNAPQALRDELRAIITANSRDGIAGALRGMATRPDSTSDLAGITAPTLALVGELDELTPPAEATRIVQGVAALPATLVTLPGVGHLSALEAPEAFGAAVEQFLNGLDRW